MSAADRTALPLALTVGDPAGIGLDITIAAWLHREQLGLPPFALFAPAAALDARARLLGSTIPTVLIDNVSDAARVFETALPLIDIAAPRPIISGKPEPANARTVINSIERAVEAVALGEASAVVTNPLAKDVLYSAGFEHPGHTEFLAVLATKHWPGSSHSSVMMLVSSELRVVPVTVHIPFKAVPTRLTTELITDKAKATARALIQDFGIANPRLAITGLNPHAGENGTMGLEDRDIIVPAITQLQALGIAVSGPHPADTLFHAGKRKTYDAVLAMYHDQALIPLKTLAFDEGVNVTINLPFVRTSPDHGTAFDIAGTGKANPSSLIEALRLAYRMGQARAACT